MRQAMWCSLNAIGLGDVDPRIYVEDIRQTIKQPILTSSRSLYHGTDVLRQQRESLSITISMLVKEYDPYERQSVIDKISAWARRGYLHLSTMPGRRLYVICEKSPETSSIWHWTERVTVGFIAYAMPFWADDAYRTVRYQGASGSVLLSPGGNIDCFLEASITAADSSLNSLTIAVGNSSFIFSGLGMKKDDTLSIGYDDENHLQYMRIGNASALSKRAGNSADDLMLHPVEPNKIVLTADGAVNAVFSARGLWR